MGLPYELLDEILGYLPLDDRESLRAYSLVARSWVSPAQSRLFCSVIITKGNYKSWKDSVSPANVGLLSHVRSLWYCTRRAECWGSLSINDFIDYLPSFHRLQHLSLCEIRIEPDISDKLEVFSAFRHSLSSLTFQTLFLTWPAFIAIVD